MSVSVEGAGGGVEELVVWGGEGELVDIGGGGRGGAGVGGKGEG